MLLTLIAAAICQPVNLPEVVVDRDNVSITRSCVLVVPRDAVIADADGNGVVHIEADGVTVRFAEGSVLRGAKVGEPDAARPDLKPWDKLSGIGVRVSGHSNVTIENASISGFKVGVRGDRCTGLTIAGGQFADNFRQRLGSTVWAEDSADWLWPHENDGDEWATNYGGAISIREAEGVTIRDVTVRRGQNGILIHRVNGSKIYDNDCSFLSGWGLAMYRSSGNMINYNAFDFCVRGHSEGVYNRGQDSAGILCFEQCSDNTFIENSATHGGDGFFGFAGLEAVNGQGLTSEELAVFDFKGRGCNNNAFIGNDFSYAPAHGLELTFSFGNKVFNNRFVENAICGIWGGYSQSFWILDNRFEGNGGMAYGLERGGINIEHGADHRITGNQFINNKCGVHLWWDPHGDFESKTWGKSNYRGVVGNEVWDNRFEIALPLPFSNLAADAKLIALQLRDVPGDDAKPINERWKNNAFVDNDLKLVDPRAIAIAIDATPGIALLAAWPQDAKARKEREWQTEVVGALAEHERDEIRALGVRRPVGARAALAGRHNIIMTPWGPWDHESPMGRALKRDDAAGEHLYEFRGLGAKPFFVLSGPGEVRHESITENGQKVLRVRVMAAKGERGLVTTGYTLHAQEEGRPSIVFSCTIVPAKWQASFFAWDVSCDPRENLQAWRSKASEPSAVQVNLNAIDLAYGGGGPKNALKTAKLDDNDRERLPGNDRFGMIAKTSIDLPAGKWRFATLSDDGVRVLVNGTPLIENWTWHGPTRDEGVFEQADPGPVEVSVEHFEIDGHAVLRLEIEPE